LDLCVSNRFQGFFIHHSSFNTVLIQIVTAFPGMFDTVFAHSIVKRAVEAGLVRIEVIDLREFTLDKHHRVDDTPFGGGPGMVMKAEPLFRAAEFLTGQTEDKPKILLPNAQGAAFNQAIADRLAQEKHLILFCGHYKGVDQRFIDQWVDEEISLGDYILSGGEIPAMIIIDAIVRLLPGAISDIESALTDSFRNGLLEGPVYTRPEDFYGLKAPEILLSGHHAKIAEWRHQQALNITRRRRPDLMNKNDDRET